MEMEMVMADRMAILMFGPRVPLSRVYRMAMKMENQMELSMAYWRENPMADKKGLRTVA